MPTTPRPTHLPIIVCLRGIAALGVVLFHFVCRTTGFLEKGTIWSLFYAGHLGVPLFFLISGIVIPLHMLQTDYSYPRWWRFVARRLVRVEPAYLIALAAGIAYPFMRQVIYGPNPNAPMPGYRDIFLHLGYLVPFVDGAKWIMPIFWTLAIEFQYYLLLAILFPLLASKVRWIQNLTILCCLVVSTGFPNEVYLLTWLPLFFTGVTYALFKFQRIKDLDYAICTIVSLTLLAASEWKNLAVVIAGLSSIHFFPNFTKTPLEWLGNLSYSLYLIHPVFGALVVNILSHHAHNGLMKCAVVLAGVAVSLASAWVLYVLVERPSHLTAKKI